MSLRRYMGTVDSARKRASGCALLAFLWLARISLHLCAYRYGRQYGNNCERDRSNHVLHVRVRHFLSRDGQIVSLPPAPAF